MKQAILFVCVPPSLQHTMVNQRISSDMKECALHLWESGWDEEDICDALLISCRSLYCWCAIFDTFGAVNKPQSPLVGWT
jgi:hypothetical protein